MWQRNTNGPPLQASLLVLALVLLLAADLRGARVGERATGLAPRASAAARGPGATSAQPAPPEGLGPRELRHLPGIGDRRAKDIADERWRRGGHFPVDRWHELRGIGPLTQAAVREELRRRGAEGPPEDESPALLHSPR
ncbi:MAG: hypothetical protein GC161_17840 [Planctomycetaceae bacterium]|nr:hypothetical protein [Planctomycetaceae bacterium]